MNLKYKYLSSLLFVFISLSQACLIGKQKKENAKLDEKVEKKSEAKEEMTQISDSKWRDFFFKTLLPKSQNVNRAMAVFTYGGMMDDGQYFYIENKNEIKFFHAPPAVNGESHFKSLEKKENINSDKWRKFLVEISAFDKHKKLAHITDVAFDALQYEYILLEAKDGHLKETRRIFVSSFIGNSERIKPYKELYNRLKKGP